MTHCASIVTGLALSMGLALAGSVQARLIDAEDAVIDQGLQKAGAAARSAAVERIVASMKPGDALLLPRTTEVGPVDLSGIPDNCTVEFGTGGPIYLGTGTHEGLSFNLVEADILAVDKPGTGLARTGTRHGTLNNCRFANITSINSANYSNSSFLSVEAARAAKPINMNGTAFTNCAVLYVWYHNPCNPCIYMDLNGSGQGSRIYQIVEHNYCETNVSVDIRNTNGLTMGVGDTESSGAALGVWSMQGCSNMLLVAHRDFKSHSRSCWGLGYMMVGGSNNKFYFVYNIGDPETYSLRARGTTGFQIWGFFGEDQCDVPADALKLFYTAEGMKAQNLAWSEPMMVEKEVIWDYNGYTIQGTQATPPAMPANYTVPEPPDVPALAMPRSTGANTTSSLTKQSRSWGREAVAAGVDMTGTRSSSDALDRLLAAEETVTLPAGTILIDRPIGGTGLGKSAAVRRIIGAGQGQTVIKAIGPIACLDGAGLAKLELVSRLTFDGGEYGVHQTSYQPGRKFDNVEFANHTIAGIRCDAGIEHDQWRYYHCNFHDIGRWGVRSENCMTDKQCYFASTFKNIGEAGISYPNTHMFAGSIASCDFQNINGPGVEIGWCKDGGAAGYTPHQSMIMECSFVECGNATRPAIDWSWMESGVIAHSKVTIKNKQWSHGILGTGQIFHACSVDVDLAKMVAGGAAFGIRSTRAAKNARPTGNVIKNCWSNGPIRFVFDELPPVALGTTGDGYNHTGLKWWHSLSDYPWAYPQLIYNSTFSNKTYDYTLLRTDRSGNVQTEVDFKVGAVRSVSPVASAVPSAAVPEWAIYDVRGRRISLVKAGAIGSAVIRALGLPRGTYVARTTVGGRAASRQVALR